MTYLKVKDKEHLLRDQNTNAIINSDYETYQAYQEAYRIKYSEKKRIENLEVELKDIKNNIDEIKNLLREIANGSR